MLKDIIYIRIIYLKEIINKNNNQLNDVDADELIMMINDLEELNIEENKYNNNNKNKENNIIENYNLIILILLIIILLI